MTTTIGNMLSDDGDGGGSGGVAATQFDRSSNQRFPETLLLDLAAYNLTPLLRSTDFMTKLNEVPEDAYYYQTDQYSLPETVQIGLFILYGINIVVSVSSC